MSHETPEYLRLPDGTYSVDTGVGRTIFAAPALLPPERLAEMQELHEAWLIYRAAHPDYPTTKESVFLELVRGHRCELLAHAAALTTRAEKAEAALEVEKAKTALLWPVATKQTPSHDAQ